MQCLEKREKHCFLSLFVGRRAKSSKNAVKTTATAIFKPVSHAWQPSAGLQWRKADQPTEMA